MLKRLNFLKTSLDAHNAYETTTGVRINANRRRNERF